MAFSKLLGAAAKVFALPDSIVPGITELTVTDGRRLYIDRHHGVLSADECFVSFDCGNFFLDVAGSQLVIDAVSRDRAYVSGKFDQLCFRRKM